MSRLLLIHEAAEAEINEAADFYDLRSSQIGSLFIDDIQRTIESISKFPNAATLIGGRVRKKAMIKFPYSILYSVYPDEIRILAVAHQKRRPFYWRSRR
jgi:plasmid stabilization system protein ParE